MHSLPVRGSSRCNACMAPVGGGGGGTLAWHVSSVQRRVEHIPRLGYPLVVAAKHRVVGQPALSPMLVGFPDDKPHVGQYVPDPFRVGLSNYGHVRSERGHPRDQGAHLPLDRLLDGVAQVQWERLQSLSEGHVVREQLSYFDKLQRLNAPGEAEW